MRIGQIKPAKGATRPSRRRGKGSASGLGGTCGKGHKGHNARSGGGVPPWFEGGQMPLQRRMPKRGFWSPTRTTYQVVNLSRLAEIAAGTVVDREWLSERRIVRRNGGPVKILGSGEIKTALTLKVDAASKKAKQAIEAAGGKVEIAGQGA